ncbi:hypothetical protein PHYPSEUDO_012725 [Phytophthora pseudosyringae]|uniref:GRIP domain-containing protein n=1 Tax=Phytophthora pseudosyringae TaxID=221518 RepID=A0A8T1W3Z6_9STRA|nr:hypothetical protein PHYPSEUDO_012725 [Phytophthora pseudosyringae]
MMSEPPESAAAPLSGACPRRSFLFLLMRKPPEFPPFSSRPAIKLSCDCGDAPTAGDDAPLQRVETEKRELIAKLKKAVVAGRAMKKQLDDARADKDAQREKLAGRFQQQLEGKEGELMVLTSKVEAFQLELRAQQEAANETQEKDALAISQLRDELQKAAGRCAQEEARVMVFQEEKNRLTNQVTAMLEHKQQQEREAQELVSESHSLQRKVQDLVQQASGARQQQEDTEHMYLEVASKLNQALRDNDELKRRGERAGASGDRASELETQIKALEADLAASADKWEHEKQQLTQGVEALTATNHKVTAELAEVAEIREKLLVHVGIDLTYESIESLFDTKSKEIQMLTEQLAAAEAPQEQAIREAVSDAVAEAEGLQSKLEALRTQYDSLATEKVEQDKTVEDLRAELERAAEEHSASLSAKEDEHQRASEEKQVEIEQLTAQLNDTQTQKQQLTDDFSSIKAKMERLVAALQIGNPASTASDSEASQSSRLEELESYLHYIHKHLVGAAKPDMEQLQSKAETLQERIHQYEEENQLLAAKLEECEVALKARASEIEKLVARGRPASSDTEKCASSGGDASSVAFNGETAEVCNGNSSGLECELEATRAQMHAVEAEMAACKAENLRMIFEVAKTADGVSKLKQDHEELLETHRQKSSELETVLVQLESLGSANQTLESNLKSKSDNLRCHLESFAMQKEDFESVISNLNSAITTAEKENGKIKCDLEDIKTENDVLEERISELHAVADSKTEPDEWQEKDREVEELRSSLVQAKVDFLEQKQQLTALEKKLVVVSKSSGPSCTVNSGSLEAERREFEAALIEMIEMEQKLQVAYEAKQGLESTLQERMEAKTDLENRLSIAEDKITELEQQLEQKVALIATIEEQLRSVEEEREKLADEFAKTKSKLERSRGKLEEKAIEFEAFKTTTNMLKDERSRLFNEIALLKDKIARSEVQKAAMADSQDLANEELEEQLNELADKIAEIETEKQDLHARLDETVIRSEEDIHQLRERLYMLEEEKSGLDDENFKLEGTIEHLESKLNSVEEQKAELEAANESSSQQLSRLEERVEKTTSEISTLSAEKNSLTELQQSLEENVSALQLDKVNLEQSLEETTSKLHDELEQVTAQMEALQTQLVQSVAEKDEVTASLSELQERAQADKLASEVVTTKLESQVAENQTLENKISVLKQMAEKALQSLQANRDELSEAESRTAVVVEEREAVKSLLHEKQSAYDELTTQREELQQQVEKLSTELESLQKKNAEEAGAAEEIIHALKDTEAKLTESLASIKRDLVEAESCVMVLVEERDAARKDLAAKDLKIEMMTSQQGELDLATQKLENELNMLRSKHSADAKASEKMLRDLKEAKTQVEETVRNLKDSSAQAEESLQAIQKQLADSELRVAVLEKERDATRTSLNEKVSTHETLSALQENLQKKVDALEAELKELRDTSSAELAAANETITTLKTAEVQEAETLASLRQELAEAEGCVMVLVEDRDAVKKTLSKRDLTLEVLGSEHGELQLKSQSVTTELEALRNKSAADTQAAEESVQALEEEVKCVTESLQSTQKELSESEARVASWTAECDTVTKALSELETEHKSLSIQKEKLVERVESLEAETTHLQSQHSAELDSAEETIRELTTSEAELNESLKSVRQELSEVESRVMSLIEEQDATKAALADQEATTSQLTSEAEVLQERIQFLESELQELQSQREADTQTAEETIRSVKESESRTVETLEAIRQKLSETEARVVSAEEELYTSRLGLERHEVVVRGLMNDKSALVTKTEIYESTVSELESMVQAGASNLSDASHQIESLESQVTQLESQLRDQVEAVEANSAKEIEALKEQVASLSESSNSALAEVAAFRDQRAAEEDSHATGIAQKDEVISTLKSKLEEVMAAYKRLKGHLQELQDRLSQQATTNDSLKTSYDELNAQHSATVGELEALKLELASSREQSSAMAEELRQAEEKSAEAEAQRESQMESFKKRVLAYDDELAQMQKQHAVVLHEQKETLLAVSAELETSVATLTETVERKELELQSTTERVRHLEQEHAQAGSDREEAGRKHEADRMELEAQLSSANESIEKLRSATHANVGLQRESISQLENQVSKLKLQVETETEGAKAARAALETYKKRAHTALKKAASENKLNLKKAAQNTTKWEQEVVSAKGRVSALETELEEIQKSMTEAASAGDALAQSAREALEDEKRSQEAALRLEIDSLKADVTRLKEVSENERVPLETQIKQLTERNEALSHEIASLREEVRSQTESMDQTVQVKEEEISDLSKKLQAALAAAASLATNEAGRRMYSPASSPTEKERRSTASSSRSFDSEGNNSFLHQATNEEQHEHITAAVADSCPIPLASKMALSNEVDQQAKSLTDEGEVVRLKLQLNELETQSHLFQKKYEDTSALLEEASRQKQRLQELDDRSTQAINIEYLKNVIMKYIQSQVPSEKEQLVPVIATLLSFSPLEHQTVMAAHKPNDEGAGLFGGVFSLFGGGAAAAPPPKPLATPHNFKPSPTTGRGNTTGAPLGSKDKKGVLSFGSDPSDDEEFATPLNPFAA